MGQVVSVFKNLNRTISVPLLLLFICSLALLTLTGDSPAGRNFFCNKGVCFYSSTAGFWNNILGTFAAGGAISILFYWILVQWPNLKKRQRIKKNLASQYLIFKTSCIENFLAVADDRILSSSPSELLSVAKFRKHFNEGVGDNRNRWHEVHNNMSDYYLNNTLSRMEVLRLEILLAMQVVDFSDSHAYEVLKRFSNVIVMQRNASRDYDSIKSFLRIFWEIFAGWDLAHGYRDTDVIEEFINSI
jgi:hypothetical protein